MSLIESGRKSVNKWHKNNLTKIGCSVRIDKAEEFKIACALLGTVPNAVFKAAIEETITKAKELKNNSEGE